jgi:hypothetical protein
MRPTGLTWIAFTGLMVLGATAAEAGVTCKVVPSWCPADDGTRNTHNGNVRYGVTASNKGVSAGTNDVAASTAGVTTSTTSVAAGTAGVTTTTNVAVGITGIAASTGAVAGKTTSVPEPASLLLLGAGVSAVGAAMRRRRKR